MEGIELNSRRGPDLMGDDEEGGRTPRKKKAGE